MDLTTEIQKTVDHTTLNTVTPLFNTHVHSASDAQLIRKSTSLKAGFRFKNCRG